MITLLLHCISERLCGIFYGQYIQGIMNGRRFNMNSQFHFYLFAPTGAIAEKVIL